MNEEQVRTFLVVARNRSITKASRHLQVSQSAVSNRLQALERELGARLLDRRRGRHLSAVLTPEGERLYALAQRWETLREEMNSISNRQGPLFRAGAPDSANRYLLPDAYSKLIDDRPEARLRITTAGTRDLYRLLDRRELDLAVVYWEEDVPDILVSMRASEEMLIVTGVDFAVHTLTISSEHLDPDREIGLDWGTRFHLWRERLLGGRVAHIHADTVSMIIPFIRKNPRLWAVVPLSVSQELSTAFGLYVYRVDPPPPPRAVYSARPKHTSAIALELCRAFDKAIEKTGRLPSPPSGGSPTFDSV